MNDYLSLGLGLICAAAGGELFVRGTVKLALWLRVSPGIVATTIAAFSTSSPELAVGINSALAGHPQISLGDTLGSNVVNVALILALALLISGLQCRRQSIKRDFPVAALVPIVVGFVLHDGVMSRLDALLLLGLFIIWITFVIREAQQQRKNNSPSTEIYDGKRSIMLCGAGLVILFVAGRLIVGGAKEIAAAYGLSEFIIGATIVAIGTSIPELATTIVAKIRHQDDISLGTILGSNIFNAWFIIPIVALIHPIVIDPVNTWGALIFGVLVVLFSYPSRTGRINRGRGVLLLILYALYISNVIHPGILTRLTG